MSEYIDREKVYIMLNAVIEGDEDEEVLETLEHAKRFIADIPAVPVKAADLAPDVRGEWCGSVCSACGESTSFWYDCNYCPHCGAKMDESEESGNE